MIRGKVMHMLRGTDPHFEQFGEVYFSAVFPRDQRLASAPAHGHQLRGAIWAHQVGTLRRAGRTIVARSIARNILGSRSRCPGQRAGRRLERLQRLRPDGGYRLELRDHRSRPRLDRTA